MNIKKNYIASRDIHVNIPIEKLIKIDQFCETYNRDSRSDGIKDLLDVGLLCVENWQKISNPEIVDQLHRQFDEGLIVDSVQTMDKKQFDILYSIFSNEHKDRYGGKQGVLR